MLTPLTSQTQKAWLINRKDIKILSQDRSNWECLQITISSRDAIPDQEIREIPLKIIGERIDEEMRDKLDLRARETEEIDTYIDLSD